MLPHRNYVLALVALATTSGLLTAQAVERDVGDIFPPDAKAERIFSDGFFTEGPAMGPDGLLYFSDITFTHQSDMQAGYIWRLDPATGEAMIWRSPSGISHTACPLPPTCDTD